MSHSLTAVHYSSLTRHSCALYGHVTPMPCMVVRVLNTGICGLEVVVKWRLLLGGFVVVYSFKQLTIVGFVETEVYVAY